MSKPKNIQLPYDDFIALLDALEYIDVENYADDFKMQFRGILELLRDKRKKIELRDSYAELINAKNESSRDLARIEYLRKKNQI